MTAPLATFNLSATVTSVSGPIAVGDALVPIGGAYYKATAANVALAGVRAQGIATTAWASSTAGSVTMQHVGVVDAATAGLGVGTSSFVRVSSAGRLERATVAGADDVCGRVETDGTTFVLFGILTASIVNGGGGGGGGATLPIVLTTDVSGILPVANGGTGSATAPAGGFAGLTAVASGDAASVSTAGTNAASAIVAERSAAATLTNKTISGASNTLSNVSLTAAVTGILPVANGGTASATAPAGGFAGLTAVSSGDASTLSTAGTNAASAIVAERTATATLTGKTIDGASNTLANVTATAFSGTLPVANGGTGITSLGTGVATFLGTPSGANLAAALTTALPVSKGGTGLTALTIPASALLVGTTDTQTLTGKTLVAASNTITGLTPANDAAAQAMGALAIDWSLGAVFTKTLGAGANTITFSNASSGRVIMVRLTGAASTVTWPTVKWAGGAAPTQTASGTDVYTFVHDGTNVYGSVVQAMA